MTAPVDLEELKRLLAEATPGPWKAVVAQKYAHIKNSSGRYVAEPTVRRCIFRQHEDAKAIAALRNSAPALIEALEAARALAKVETAIVDRIWDQLGRPTYEELQGRSIHDLIDALKEQAVKAEALRWEIAEDEEKDYA